jgi:hypothetical protein
MRTAIRSRSTFPATVCDGCESFPCVCRRDPLHRTRVRCECACGLAIVAESRADADIVQAVQRHQAVARHIAWRSSWT